ncbi:MAG: hypothetical protein U1E53_10145 [Dongiaceae bacterium]
MVCTDGLDGQLHDYEIAYTFGVHPLQQYSDRVSRRPLPGARHVWDSWPAAEGGQRWFDLYPGQMIRARSAALDRSEPDLELHVRRLPFDQLQRNFDLGVDEQLSDNPAGDQRVLRGLPRAGLAPSRSRKGGAAVDPGSRRPRWSR